MENKRELETSMKLMLFIKKNEEKKIIRTKKITNFATLYFTKINTCVQQHQQKKMIYLK